MNIAVIGASNNPTKYGNKIVKDLIAKGYRVFPINPKETLIEGLTVYQTLGEIGNSLDIVNFVVPPYITLATLQQNKDFLKNKKVWIQPGAEDEMVKQFLEENAFTDYLVGVCIMVTKI